jgi:hypothetical protein
VPRNNALKRRGISGLSAVAFATRVGFATGAVGPQRALARLVQRLTMAKRSYLGTSRACMRSCASHAVQPTQPAKHLHHDETPALAHGRSNCNKGQIFMTAIEDTALGRLDQEGRLLNAVLKGPTTKPGRFGFRGDIALKFQTQVADEKRPPEISMEQVLTVVQDGESTIPVLAGYLHSFAYLGTVVEVLDGLLSPTGTYFMYCNNIDLLAKYRVTLGNIPFSVLPCDESTVWKEMLDLMSIDKNDIKKLDTAGKLDYLLDAALEMDAQYQPITFEEGLARMEPVKNRNENRPV